MTYNDFLYELMIKSGDDPSDHMGILIKMDDARPVLHHRLLSRISSNIPIAQASTMGFVMFHKPRKLFEFFDEEVDNYEELIRGGLEAFENRYLSVVLG